MEVLTSSARDYVESQGRTLRDYHQIEVGVGLEFWLKNKSALKNAMRERECS